jgi:alkylated DNA repair protein alkB homolog 6
MTELKRPKPLASLGAALAEPLGPKVPASTYAVLYADLVPDLSYYPDYVSEEQEAALLDAIDSRRWKPLNRRKLQNYGGLPHAKGMIPTPLPTFLAPLAASLASPRPPLPAIFDPAAPPNHALVNRYEAGEGIDAHQDGPVFLPIAAILSLQSPIVMDFYSKNKGRTNAPVASIVLRPRSLLCMTGESYENYMHAIAQRPQDDIAENAFGSGPAKFDREQRTSITLRRSAKTLKNKLRF